MADYADMIDTNNLSDWLVIGFFTPNYRALAETLAISLREQNHPFHFFAVETSARWSHVTMLKPTIVLNAMEIHPKKSLILMDVDCIVNGSLSGLEAFGKSIDIACFATLRAKKIRRERQHFSLSSRVMLIRPTNEAREFIKKWRDACNERPWMNGDEPNLVLALTRSSGIAFSPLPRTYAGREYSGKMSQVSLISHKSAAKFFGRSSTTFSQKMTAFRKLFSPRT